MAGPTTFKLMFVFDTKAEADAAAALCDTGMAALLTEGNAERWAIPQQRQTDGKWFFTKPIGPVYSCGRCKKVPKCVYTTQNMQSNWTVED